MNTTCSENVKGSQEMLDIGTNHYDDRDFYKAIPLLFLWIVIALFWLVTMFVAGLMFLYTFFPKTLIGLVSITAMMIVFTMITMKIDMHRSNEPP
jgi:hypothetical protein